MRKLAILGVEVASLGIAGVALAGNRVQLKNSATDQQEAARKARYDHPRTQVIPNKDLKVVITTDAIMHSCCMPPNLVVAGDVTNLGAGPVNYVRLLFSFEDKDGKVIYAESVYNIKAASMGQDDDVARVLNEKPHFEPLPPGASDHFSFVVPTTVLPRFAKVELYPNAVIP